MSPPQLTGHAARAVISTERRVQIWDQFYISFKETIPHYQWCTREQLVKAACSGKTGVKFTVDELTEVIRGRKHKREAGVDSEKVDGEWLYRFIPPGGKAKASMMPPASTPSKRAAPSPAAKAKPKTKPKTTPKRNAPLRPRAKSPTKTPPPRASSASRKRATPSAAAEPEPIMTTRLRSAKKPRPSPRPRGGQVAAKKSGGNGGGNAGGGGDDSGGAGTVGGMFRFGGGSDGGEDGERGGWSCAVM